MNNQLDAFFKKLQQSNFRGEYSIQDDQLSVYSTDNSIYQREPQAVIWPKSNEDIQAVMRLINHEDFRSLSITARGGGTGTNGQSLTTGIVLDLSRFMNQILEIDPKNRTVKVQAGVVKDQLNAVLKPHGLFFAPDLSTSNRATIGGMINTDASGQGSCRYGKTHHHVIALKSVALNGEFIESSAINRDDITQKTRHKSKWQQSLYHQLFELAHDNKDTIKTAFPKLNRALTGYDLPNLLNDEAFNLNNILCGSEGSLAIISEATLNLVEIPKFRALINVGYENFQQGLSDAKALMQLDPLSIETIDSKVLDLAKNDIIWDKVAHFFEDNDQEVNGINLVEINAASEDKLSRNISNFIDHLKSDTQVKRLSITYTDDLEGINDLYAMRKKAVGLLGNVSGDKRPIPFVEDCAVPPENLTGFISEFRKLLDEAGLSYGMFGHVDAGVLHVRPQLNLRDKKVAEQVNSITEKVVALLKKYGGVLWGEHGKGLRSSFAPHFFGNAWPLLQEVKYLFDPNNQLNPGKIATPAHSKEKLTGLLDVKLRGDKDRLISQDKWQYFGAAMYCNGNAACFNYDYNDAMCPSWKQSRDRIHSPKGRATLIKEWLYRDANNTLDDQFETQVYDALHGCLSCKSCAGQCPVRVDIPDAKAKFLAIYFKNHKRKLRDYLIANIEAMLPILHKVAPIYNCIQGLKITKAFQRKQLSACNIPTFDNKSHDLLKANATFVKNINNIQLNKDEENIFIVQDAFTRYFDTAVLIDWITLLNKLGVNVYVLPYFSNGKPKHVHGFLDNFYQLRDKNEKIMEAANRYQVPMVGLDPAMTLVFRQEYLGNTEKTPKRKILLPQEWLSDYLERKNIQYSHSDKTFYLASHCTEKTNLANSDKMWENIFQRFGIPLQTLKTGCCGMAGTYGHEVEHEQASREIYALSWQKKIDKYESSVVVSGYSCRCQVKNQSQIKAPHPVQALLARLST